MHNVFKFSLSALVAISLTGHAAVVNPLMSPKMSGPAGDPSGNNMSTVRQNAGTVRTGPGSITMPPPPPNSGSYPPVAPIGDRSLKLEIQTIPVEIANLEDRWFVSAISANSAILRPRTSLLPVANPNSATTGAPMGGAFGSAGVMPATGAQTTNASSGSVMRSLMVTDGEVIDFKGESVKASIKNSMVVLTYNLGGKPVTVFKAGIDVYAVQRTVQQAKETPNSAYANSLTPSRSSISNASSTATPGAQTSPTNQNPF